MQEEFCQNILKLSCWPLTFTLYKAFQETKAGLELICSPHFLHNFWSKIFCTLYFINKFHCLIACSPWDIRYHMCCNYLLSSLWHWKFQKFLSKEESHTRLCPIKSGCVLLCLPKQYVFYVCDSKLSQNYLVVWWHAMFNKYFCPYKLCNVCSFLFISITQSCFDEYQSFLWIFSVLSWLF